MISLRARRGGPDEVATVAVARRDGRVRLVAGGRRGAVEVPAARLAHAVQDLAARAGAPLVLLQPAGLAPGREWLDAAREQLAGAPAVACVGAGEPGGAGPALLLDPGRVLVRRRALLDSGGLDAGGEGCAGGPDLAWRLWAMGHEVAVLPGWPPPAEAEAPGAYRLACNWARCLARNADDGAVDWALSRAVLAMLALAGRAVQAHDTVRPPRARPPSERAYIEERRTLRPHAGDLAAPWHEVRREVGELLAALHDLVEFVLPIAWEERPRVQALRRRPDGEIAAALGRDPAEIAGDYFAGLLGGALNDSGKKGV